MYDKFMANYYKALSKKFDKDIRVKCGLKNNLLENCLRENFNDIFDCEFYLKNFNYCVKKFDEEFRNKYNIKKNLKKKI